MLSSVLACRQTVSQGVFQSVMVCRFSTGNACFIGDAAAAWINVHIQVESGCCPGFLAKSRQQPCVAVWGNGQDAANIPGGPCEATSDIPGGPCETAGNITGRPCEAEAQRKPRIACVDKARDARAWQESFQPRSLGRACQTSTGGAKTEIFENNFLKDVLSIFLSISLSESVSGSLA